MIWQFYKNTLSPVPHQNMYKETITKSFLSGMQRNLQKSL